MAREDCTVLAILTVRVAIDRFWGTIPALPVDCSRAEVLGRTCGLSDGTGSARLESACLAAQDTHGNRQAVDDDVASSDVTGATSSACATFVLRVTLAPAAACASKEAAACR